MGTSPETMDLPMKYGKFLQSFPSHHPGHVHPTKVVDPRSSRACTNAGASSSGSFCCSWGGGKKRSGRYIPENMIDMYG